LITPAQYAVLEAKASAIGLAISGPSGTATMRGVTASWSYDGTRLIVTVVSAPPFFTGMAEREIASAVDEALKS
jgi:hypothetical protein